uniref:uncharacterized protein LOC122604462 n=1 Tax=Erigeron canadensis TaxID=72917 RepID=UPI001CB96F60|nr:uncharacterized protein LOC122604462 [Erigeron canadensis]
MERYMDMNDKRHGSLESYAKMLNEKISNLNQKIDEGARNQQASIKELERRIDRWIEQNARKESSSPPRQIIHGSSSSNPSTSQKYQPQIGRNENVNAVFTEGNDCTEVSNYSCEVSNLVHVKREQNEGETNKNAILESAQELPAPLVTLQVQTSAVRSPQVAIQRCSNTTSAAQESVRPISGETLFSEGDVEVQFSAKYKIKDGNNSDRIEEVHNPDTLDDEAQLPQAFEYPGSFLIPCTINNEYFSSALADLGSSINVMLTVIYEKLTLCLLKPADMSIRLADQTYRQPKGIVERVHVRVNDLEFWTEFVVLDKCPL